MSENLVDRPAVEQDISTHEEYGAEACSTIAHYAHFVVQLEADATTLRAEVARLKEAYDDHVVRLTEDVVRLMAEPDRLKAIVASQEELLARLRAERDAAISDGKEEIADRESDICDLRRKLDEADRECNALSMQTEELVTRWEDAEALTREAAGLLGGTLSEPWRIKREKIRAFKAAHPELFKRAGPDPGVAPTPRKPEKAPERPVDASGG